MTETPMPIVVGVDGSGSALDAVDWAADDAARRQTELRIVTVRDPDLVFPGQSDDADRAALASAAARAGERLPDLAATTELMSGEVIGTLLEAAGAAQAVVIGHRGVGGFVGQLLGSVGLGLAGHTPGPLVVVRGRVGADRGEIVAGFDGSPHSEAAMRYAFEAARLRSARLRVVYAWPMPVSSPLAFGYRGRLAGVFDDLAESAAIRLAPWRERNPDVEVIDDAIGGHPVPALSAASTAADLVVVGSRGRRAFRSAVLGSVSHGVLLHAECPVAVIGSP
jgi:nucleotide-binding universal stress UspA family protein